jgi:hypothetical protein
LNSWLLDVNLLTALHATLGVPDELRGVGERCAFARFGARILFLKVFDGERECEQATLQDHVLRALANSHCTAIAPPVIIDGKSLHFVSGSSCRAWAAFPYVAGSNAMRLVPGSVEFAAAVRVSNRTLVSLDHSGLVEYLQEQAFWGSVAEITGARLNKLKHPCNSPEWELGKTISSELLPMLREYEHRVLYNTIGWVHGDLKPSNILMTSAGPCLIDWEATHVDFFGYDLIYLFSESSDDCESPEELQSLWSAALASVKSEQELLAAVGSLDICLLVTSMLAYQVAFLFSRGASLKHDSFALSKARRLVRLARWSQRHVSL